MQEIVAKNKKKLSNLNKKSVIYVCMLIFEYLIAGFVEHWVKKTNYFEMPKIYKSYWYL